MTRNNEQPNGFSQPQKQIDWRREKVRERQRLDPTIRRNIKVVLIGDGNSGKVSTSTLNRLVIGRNLIGFKFGWSKYGIHPGSEGHSSNPPISTAPLPQDLSSKSLVNIKIHLQLCSYNRSRLSHKDDPTLSRYL